MFFEQYTVFHAAYGTQLTQSFEAKRVFCLFPVYQKCIFHSALNYCWKHKRKYILQLFEDDSFSLFGICSTEKALVPYLCNCKVCFTTIFPFFFLVIELYFAIVSVIQNSLYCFNVLVSKISTAIQGREQQYHTTSHKGVYMRTKIQNLCNSYSDLFLLTCKVSISNSRPIHKS